MSERVTTRTLHVVPLYEYRCRACDETFERRRPMSESSDLAECSSGHFDSVRLLSVFANVGASSAGASGSAGSASGRGAQAVTPTPRSGGMCGSGCGCHH